MKNKSIQKWNKSSAILVALGIIVILLLYIIFNILDKDKSINNETDEISIEELITTKNINWGFGNIIRSVDYECRVFILTDHPDNVWDENQINPNGKTYFTKGKNAILISIDGKDGNFLQQNEFKVEDGQYMDIWAKTSKNNTPIKFSDNGKLYPNCIKAFNGGQNVITDSDDREEVSSIDRENIKADVRNMLSKIIDDPMSEESEVLFLSHFTTVKVILNGVNETSNWIVLLDEAKNDGKDIKIVDIDISSSGVLTKIRLEE